MKKESMEFVHFLFTLALLISLLVNFYQLKQRNIQLGKLLKKTHETVEIIKIINDQNIEKKKNAYAEFQAYYDILTNHKNIRREYISGLSVMLFERYNDVCEHVPSDKVGIKYDSADALAFVNVSAEEQKTYLQKISKQTKFCFEYKYKE